MGDSCRVAALVREGKFEEAEQLVQEHHLDTEVRRILLCVEQFHRCVCPSVVGGLRESSHVKSACVCRGGGSAASLLAVSTYDEGMYHCFAMFSII